MDCSAVIFRLSWSIQYLTASFLLLQIPNSCFAAEPASTTGKSDRAAILRELTDYSLTGMDHRLGPDYASYHPQGPAEKFPEIWMPPSKQDPGGRRYQIGGPWTKQGGDFSSTQGQILYVPDRGGFGVDRVTILEWSNGTFSERPEPPWWGGFRPEPALKKWEEAMPDGNVGSPIATARGIGAWANNGLTIFSSGLVAAAGTATARGLEPAFRFPPSKLPLAIAITNKSEFALVTLSDRQRHVGQVAVFSLEVNGKKTHFVHEWQDDHAWSLPSVGLLTNLKLLGYVDLPGIEFPTGVSAVGNKLNGRMNGRDGNAGLLREYDLAHQADRDVFLKGPNADYSSGAGYAVVIGKYENKAAVLDLKPLFQGVRAMYFTTEENYQKTRDAGPEPGQWPYAFEADPRWKPSVVEVLSVSRPTAVIAGLPTGNNKVGPRFLIASENGQIGVFSAGTLGSEAPAPPAAIARMGVVQAGRNPVCLAYQKGAHDTVIVVSRGDREVSWLQYTAEQPRITRRLRDERMLDPVFVEVADTHGIETSLLTVADFKGRQIINYRYSTVIFATQGGARFGLGPKGKDEFECGGVLEFPGAPFCISASNVN